MAIDEQIYQCIQQLPISLQAELLSFLHYLLMKVEREERQQWSSLSLHLAMQDMESEPNLYRLGEILLRAIGQISSSRLSRVKQRLVAWLSS